MTYAVPRQRRTKAVVALVLTFAAGYVDIVGLLTIYNLFTAHMTGTTVHLGEATGRAELGRSRCYRRHRRGVFFGFGFRGGPLLKSARAGDPACRHPLVGA
jgi:hypothetical protein